MRVRQALATAIDREQICQFAFFGLCTPIQGPTGPGTPWYFPYAPYDHDLDAARALLADAGVADGFTIQIMTAIGFDETLRAAQVIQQQLAELEHHRRRSTTWSSPSGWIAKPAATSTPSC